MGNSSSKKKQLTLKQRKWIAVYLATGNATEAARQVYNCKTDASAAVIGYENLRKLKISVDEMMDKMEVSDARLIKVLDKGLEASKTVIEKIDGEVEVIPDVPDFANIHKFLVTALKLRGYLLGLQDQEGEVQVAKIVLMPVKQVDKEGEVDDGH